MHVPMGQYHTCKSMESGTVIIEFYQWGLAPVIGF